MGLQLAVLQAVPLFCLAGQASHSSVRFWFPSFANFASFCLKMSSCLLCVACFSTISSLVVELFLTLRQSASRPDRSSSVTGICYPLSVVPFDWPSLGNQFIRMLPLGVTVNGRDDHEFVGASAIHMFQQFFS